MSDASGSPFFIGPENCKLMSIRSIQRMDNGNLWNGRVFDCNYRGDYVANVRVATGALAETQKILDHLTK